MKIISTVTRKSGPVFHRNMPLLVFTPCHLLGASWAPESRASALLERPHHGRLVDRDQRSRKVYKKLPHFSITVVDTKMLSSVILTTP